MRNLKKILALVLALVMSLSLVTMANADFSDAADIEHDEAVEVMAKIGVLQGSDGKFDPKGTLTRAQAAKIIAYVLTGGEPAKVTGASFSDVPASHWAASTIAYVAGKGIVDGNGDGTFNPNGQLTGYAFAKMLLNALEIEGTYTGMGWEINVADAAEDADLLVALDDVALGTALSREHAAQMALNAVKAAPGSEKYHVVKMASGKEVKFDNKSDALLYAGLKDGAEYDGLKSDPKASLLFTVFEVEVKDGSDDFGRPATEYVHDDWTLTYADAATYTYVNEWDEDEAEKLDDDEIVYDEAAIYYNGKTGELDIDDLYAPTGDAVNGYAIEMYDTDDDDTIEIIVVVEEYFAQVTKYTAATAKKDAEVELTVYEYGYPTGKAITFVDDDEKDDDTYDLIAASFKEDDYVAVVLAPQWDVAAKDKADLLSIEAVEAVKGALTKVSSGAYTCLKKVTVAGKAYGLNNEFIAVDALTLKDEGTLFLDAQGCALAWIADEPAEATIEDVVYVADVFEDEVTNKYKETTTTYYAQIIDLEGKVSEIVIGIDGDDMDEAVGVDSLVSDLYTYEKADDDDYEYYTFTAWTDEDYEVDDTLTDDEIEADDTKLDEYRLNSKTTYIMVEGEGSKLKASAKVGGVDAKFDDAFVIASESKGNYIAEYVFIFDAEDLEAAAEYENVIYVDADADYDNVLAGEDDTACVEVVVYDAEGKELTIIVAKTEWDALDDGFYAYDIDDSIYTLDEIDTELDEEDIADEMSGIVVGDFDGYYETLMTVDGVEFETKDAAWLDLTDSDIEDAADIYDLIDNEDISAAGLAVYFEDGVATLIVVVEVAE